jgi:hypothetical protein
MISLDHRNWVVLLKRVAVFPLVAVRIEGGNAGNIGGMSRAQSGATDAQSGKRCCHILSGPPQRAHHFEYLADSIEGALYLGMVNRPGLEVQLMGNLIQVVSHAPDFL